MAKPVIDLYANRPLLDIVSYGRGARGDRIQLSRAQIEQIARTVRRAPEVMIKVLPKDSNNAKSIRNHIDYIGRHGKLELEDDDGTLVSGQKAGEKILEDWDLDMETHRRDSEFESTRGRPPPKLVHKLIFSMPPGTPPDKLMAAVRSFAREEFALMHRYVMVLHTDEPHPHAHVMVKAISEQGARLNIRKATLREWRNQFARHLRAQGIAANATERAVRGEVRPHKIDGIFRAERRGASTRTEGRAADISRELLSGDLQVESGKSKLLRTRKEVEHGWLAVSDMLLKQGYANLAADAERFLERMPVPRTEKELLAQELLGQVRNGRVRRQSMSR